MSELTRSESNRIEQNNVVQLNAGRAASSPIPAQIVLIRLPAAMHSLRDKARQQLQVLLRDLFDKVDDAMFELADKATNNHEQNVYFDSMREVRLCRRAIETAFFRNIDIRFAQLLDHTAYRDEVAVDNKEFSIDDLSLVQNDELEEMVAMEAMINKANEQFSEAIQHLTLRIDHLVPIKVYQKNNPLGVDAICHAFNEASKNLSIDVKAKLVLFKLFDNMVMTKLGGLLQALNQTLIDANIMPSLKQQRRSRLISDTANQHYGAGISANVSDTQKSSATNASNPTDYDEQTNQVFHTLRGLLGARSSAPAQPTNVNELASQELINMLSQAQQQNYLSNNTVQLVPTALNVRELLQNLLQTMAPQQSPQVINQVDDDVINLVSMMFDFILDDRNLASPMKALIGRLQLPMVKVAIADKTFFSKGGHPARRLLNEMAMAALGWQESNTENQRKDSLYNKMEATVQTILSDFETDMSIFNLLLTDFRAFLEKDKRRALILEQRTIDAEDGKAKSERARMQVDSTLNRMTSGHVLPVAGQKLLYEAWGNVLFISALKHGTESDQWQTAIRTAQQLVWSLTAPMSSENRQSLLKLVPELLQKLRYGLQDIAFSPFETTQLFKQLESLHLARLRTVPQVSNTTSATSTTAAFIHTELLSKNSTGIHTTVTDAVATDVIEVTNHHAVVTVSDSLDQTIIPADINMANLLQALDLELDLEQEHTVDLAPIAETALEPTMVTAMATAMDSVEQVPAPTAVAFSSLLLADISDTTEPTADTSLASLETFVVVDDEPTLSDKNELPENDEHLTSVNHITQGSWFEMQSNDGQKFRCRLAAIIRATGKYIFVNRSGMKVAEETKMSLALSLKSGRLHLLDDGMLFDRALEAVIGNLRANKSS